MKNYDITKPESLELFLHLLYMNNLTYPIRVFNDNIDIIIGEDGGNELEVEQKPYKRIDLVRKLAPRSVTHLPHYHVNGFKEADIIIDYLTKGLITLPFRCTYRGSDTYLSRTENGFMLYISNVLVVTIDGRIFEDEIETLEILFSELFEQDLEVSKSINICNVG